MLWVDYQDYFGPDRRRASAALRLRERRRENYAGAPPALNVALRQLRMHAIDAHGSGLGLFASRVKSCAMLAAETGFFEVSGELAALSAHLAGPCGGDPRDEIYDAICRAEAALHTLH
jgi:hypothetical protein